MAVYFVHLVMISFFSLIFLKLSALYVGWITGVGFFAELGRWVDEWMYFW